MTGIEILAIEEIYNTIIPEGWIAFAFPLMVMSFVLAIVFICDGSYGLSGVFIGLAACGLVLLILASVSDTTNIDYVKYKVTISDEVSMNEFSEKYEILDQEGKIYTVRERE